jgi:cytochrome c oxidase subunit 2
LTKSILTAGVALAAALAIFGAQARAKDNASSTPKTVEIHAKKFAYEPAEITLHKGEAYKLHLTSDDVPHTLRISALNLNAKMQAGEFNDVLFTPEQIGDFKADCGIYCGAGHKTMFLSVHVVQ